MGTSSTHPQELSDWGPKLTAEVPLSLLFGTHFRCHLASESPFQGLGWKWPFEPNMKKEYEEEKRRVTECRHPSNRWSDALPFKIAALFKKCQKKNKKKRHTLCKLRPASVLHAGVKNRAQGYCHSWMTAHRCPHIHKHSTVCISRQPALSLHS